MENKYYTPTIDEFHVGFEYEYLTIKDIWINDIFGSVKPDDTEQMDFEIVRKICKDEPNQIRVKYLDKEDIENLGFNSICKDNLFITFILTDNLKRNWTLMLCLYDKGRIILKNDCYFMDINIKNKSELKVLLKQLNIL